MLRSYVMHYKKHITVISALLTLTLATPLMVTFSYAKKQLNSAAVANYQVVDLSAEPADSSDMVVVSGGIKNFSYTSIRGHAIIYLVDGNQSVLQAEETTVNDGQSFKHSQVGHFETTLNTSGLHNVQSVSVEFVMDRF